MVAGKPPPSEAARMPETFTLHGIFLSGPSMKVGLMLRLCRQPFAYRHVDLRSGAQKQPAYLALNRYGVVPTLQHGGLNLCQSNAILEYLADTLGKFAGADATGRARVREWLFWDFDRLSPGIFRSRAIARGFYKADAAVAEAFRAAGEAGLAEVDKALGGSAFLTGASPTAADVACHVVVALAPEGGFDLARYGNIQAWSKRMAALPGMVPVTEVLPQADAPAVAA
jgi:glutathione S-transferase